MQPIPAAWWKALLLSYAGTSHVNKIKNKKNKSLAAKSNAVVEINTMICVCGGWSAEEGTNFSEKDGKGTAWEEGILTSSVLPGARISVCEESGGVGSRASNEATDEVSVQWKAPALPVCRSRTHGG